MRKLNVLTSDIVQYIMIKFVSLDAQGSYQQELCETNATVCQDVLLKIKFNGQIVLEATFIQMF